MLLLLMPLPRHGLKGVFAFEGSQPLGLLFYRSWVIPRRERLACLGASLAGIAEADFWIADAVLSSELKTAGWSLLQ